MRPMRTLVGVCFLVAACSADGAQETDLDATSSGGTQPEAIAQGGAPPQDSPTPSGGSPVSAPTNDGDPDLITSDEPVAGGSGAGGGSSLDVDSACAGSTIGSERLPIDLYFMVDITGSMNCPAPDAMGVPCSLDPGPPYADTTRWDVASAALSSFVNAEANAGLGVGLGFFPVRRNICSVNSYMTPTVEIADLPSAAPQLTASIGSQRPQGNTPTLASLTGALHHAARWAEAHPQRRVAVVYSTDGYPVGCRGSTIDAAAEVAQTALETNGIRTYVLGMGQNLSSLNQIALAGGTEQAYLVDTGDDAAAQLADALSAIRGNAALGCTFSIPEPPPGKTIDFNKVNLRYTSDSGEVTEVLRDPSETECNQGWQYSTDKTQVSLCGQLCDSMKSDVDGSLDILLGCKTKTHVAK